MVDSRIGYKCGACSFRFTRAKGVTFKHCPYCGKEGTVMVDKGNTASKILDEVSKIREI